MLCKRKFVKAFAGDLCGPSISFVLVHQFHLQVEKKFRALETRQFREEKKKVKIKNKRVKAWRVGCVGWG